MVGLNTVGLLSYYPITGSRFIRFNLVSSLVSATLPSLNPTFLLRMLMTARYFCLKFRFILIQRVFYANFPTAEEQKWSWARSAEEEVGEKEKKLVLGEFWLTNYEPPPPLLCPIKVPVWWNHPLTTFCCSQFPLGDCSRSPLQHLQGFYYPCSDIRLVITS